MFPQPTTLRWPPGHYLQAKQLATKSETCRLIQSCQERSHQRFPLSDLLSVPIQRFLKYPLLMKVHLHYLFVRPYFLLRSPLPCVIGRPYHTQVVSSPILATIRTQLGGRVVVSSL